MKKMQKIIGISVFGMLVFGTTLLTISAHAAKVCVADSLYERFLSGYRNWYCHTGAYVTAAYNTTYHGSGNYCHCLIGGAWSYSPSGNSCSGGNCSYCCQNNCGA
jgi:hypothetical protein